MIKRFARSCLQAMRTAEFHEDVRSMEPEELSEDQWEQAVFRATTDNDAWPALALYVQGLRPPPLARAALEDVVARKAGKVPRVRPAYGRAAWRRAAREKAQRQREKRARVDAYLSEIAALQEETGRSRRGLQDEAIPPGR